MSASITHHASVQIPVTDPRSTIELQEFGSVFGIKELHVSAPTKQMLLDLLQTIELRIARTIKEVKEMPDENRTA